MTGRLALLWAGGTVAAALLVLGAAPAAGQTPEPGTGGMTLVGQTTWVEPNGTFELVLSLPGVYNFDDEAIVSVHERVEDLADLRTTLDGDDLGATLGVVRTTLGALTTTPEGEASVSMVMSDGTEPEQDGVGEAAPTILVPTPGVYPVRISLQTAGGNVLGQMLTHAIRVPTGEGVVHPMAVATVVDLDADPAAGPGSAPSPDDLDRIRAWTVPLESTGLPATLRITPWLFDARGTTVLPDQLRRVAVDREVSRAPWVRTDEAMLAEAGVGPLVDELWDRGDQTLERELDAAPSPGLWVSEDDSPPSLQRYVELADQGITAVVLPETAAPSPSRPPNGPAGDIFEVEDRRFVAVTALTEATGALVGADDPVLAAQHLLAELAIRAFGGERAATLLLHSQEEIHPRSIAVLFEELAASALHEPTTAGALLADVPSSPTAVPLTATAGPVPALVGDPTLLGEAFETLNGYRSMVFDADTALLYDPLRRDLWLSLTSGVDAEVRDDVWRQITARLLQEVDAITPPPPIEVFLTARQGLVPFSFENALDYPIRVEVRFISDQVTFVDLVGGETATLVLEPGVTSREFTVEARTSGRFPLEVLVRSPDGTLALAAQRVNVRSTALSAIGVAVAIGAAAFLLAWWLVQWRRRRPDAAVAGEPYWRETRLPEKVGAET